MRPTVPAPAGHYGCPKCKTVKPLSAFYQGACYLRGHSPYCVECKRQWKRDRERAGQASDPTAAERFWAKVEKRGPDDCWEWTGTKRHGHGHFYYMGKMQRAHRVSLELHGTPCPEDMHVDHTCRNRGCVNPAHLRFVTPGQNALENNDSIFAKNHHATECVRGHSLTDERNLAVKVCVGPKGTVMLTRICLACVPDAWRFAIIERGAGAGIKQRKQWAGPQTIERDGARAKAKWLNRPGNRK